MIKKINTFKRHTRYLRNGEHILFGRTIAGKLKEELPKTGIETAITLGENYSNRVNHEDMLMKYERPSDKTPALRATKARRDEAYTILIRMITVNAKYGRYNPAMQTAAASLMHIVKNYKGIKSKSQTDETGLMDKMIEDLDTPASKEALAILGLQPAVEEMRAANTAFDSNWHTRAHEEESRRQHGTVRQSRSRADEALSETLDLILSVYNSGMAPVGVNNLLDGLIDYINEEITSVLKILSRHGAPGEKKHKHKATEGNHQPIP